jgi:hypothetical protein
MIDIDEENLLRQYAQAKDTEIGRLLEQYGSSLKEVREMYPQLTGAISQRQLTTAFPTQPLFFTPSEAQDMGLALQEGWMLKMSPIEGGEGYTSSFITPTKWEITEGGQYISPTGEKYSEADIVALLSVPMGGLTTEEIPTTPLTIENLTEEGQRLYGEYQTAGGGLDVAGWLQEQQSEQLETEQIFGKVFPEQDIQEVLDYMTNNPEGFLADIRELGPTEDMVAFLKSLEFKDAAGNIQYFTDDEISQLFQGVVPAQYVPESWLKDNILDPLYAGAVSFVHGIKQTFTSILPSVMTNLREFWLRVEKPIMPSGLEEFHEKDIKIIQEGAEQQFLRLVEQNKTWIEVHPELTPKPEYSESPFDNPALFKDPGYYAYSFTSSLAYTLSTMGTIVAVSAIATPFVGIPAGMLVAGAPEASSMTEELVRQGIPFEEATKWGTLYGSIAGGIEMVSDLPLLGLLFKPIKTAMAPIWKTIFKGVSNRIVKGVIAGVIIPNIEGLEEAISQVAYNAILKHYDATQSILEGVSQSYIQATIGALPFGVLGGAASFQTFRSNLSTETGQKYDEAVKKFQNAGLTEGQAQVQAANEIAMTLEGEAAMFKAIEVAREEYQEEHPVTPVQAELADKLLDEMRIAEEVAKKVTPVTTEVTVPKYILPKVGDTFFVPETGSTFKLTKWWGRETPSGLRTDLSGYWTVKEIKRGEKELVRGRSDFITSREMREQFGEGKWTRIKPEVAIPTTEAGMPEAGLQPSGIEEFLATDPIATYTVHVGKRKVHLDYFLKNGDWPETFTVKEAAALMQKPVEWVQSKIKKGGIATNRVESAYVLDELSEQFHTTEEEFIRRLKGIYKLRQQLERGEGEIPETPPGMPEQGLQAGIPGMATAEPVRPQPTGRLVQARIDDYLRLREYNAKAVTERIAEIKKQLETLAKTPTAQVTKGDLRLELARLEVQQELDEVETIQELDSVIKDIETELGNRAIQPGVRNLFKEYTTRQLDEMRNVYQQARQMIPEVAKKVTPESKWTPMKESLFQKDLGEMYDAGKEIADELKANGYRLNQNPDGTITIYHGTSEVAANAIRQSGRFDEMSFFSHAKSRAAFGSEGAKQYGPEVLEIKADPRDVDFNSGTGEIEAEKGLVRGKDGIWRAPDRVLPWVTPEVTLPKAEVPLPQPPPEVINRVKTDPTPASDEIILKKFIDCIKDAKPAREVTEALKHEELQRRSAIFASILQGGEGYKAFEKAKGALKGFLPQGEYLLDLQKFGVTDADIERMIDRIRLDDKLQPFQKLNTYEAFTNLVMGAIPTEGELLLLEKEFGPELTKAIMSKLPAGAKALKILQDIANIPRTLKTIADISATFRQGAMLIGQPVQFAEAFKEQLKVVFSEKNFKLIDEIVHNNVYADKAEQHKLYIAPISEVVSVTAREEAFMGRLIERVPIVGSIVRASERAYVTFLNVLRMETWAYYCRQWEGTGKSVADYGKLASFINHASGRGDLGAFSRAAPWLSATFFSPRFIMSRIQAPLDLITTTPAVRKVIARNLVSFVGVGLLAQVLAELGGGDREKDPRSSDFGKIKIGNTRIDFWAGFQPYVRVIAQIITEERKSTQTGEIYKIDPIDIGVNFFRSKLAPVPGLLWDLKSGKTFIGEELNAENAEKIIYEQLTPMGVQDWIDAVRDSGWVTGTVFGILSMLGLGVQTYSDNWGSAELKLGLPQRSDNLPYTVENAVYDVKDYYSEISGMIGGATYEMLSDKKNIPEKVLSVAKAKDILREIDLLPNKRLTNINADSTKGDTYEQYRTQWLARQKITNEEELVQFDKDYPDAYLGNMTQAQYALLVQYNSLPEDQKADFLGRHPELYINPREEWLRTHPEENALLALWGKANVYSTEALNKVSTLSHSLDIPENALVMKDMDEVTELKLKNQHLSDLLEAYGGLDDTLKGPDGLTARDRAVQQLYLNNPEFRDDERRIEAIDVGTKDNPTLETMVEGWVERGQIADEFGSSSAEMKLWLIDNKEVHQWALENGLLSDTGEDWNEDILRLEVNYKDDFDKYDDYGNEASPGYIANDTARADAREAMLFSQGKMTSFGVASYTIDALQKNIPENLVTTYVDYFGIRKKEGVDYSAGWYEDDWYLMEHKEFYDTMYKLGIWTEPKDFSKVPTREVYNLYKTYMGKPTGTPRLDYRKANPVLDDWLVLAKGYTPIGNR